MLCSFIYVFCYLCRTIALVVTGSCGYCYLLTLSDVKSYLILSLRLYEILRKDMRPHPALTTGLSNRKRKPVTHTDEQPHNIILLNRTLTSIYYSYMTAPYCWHSRTYDFIIPGKTLIKWRKVTCCTRLKCHN